MRKNVLLHASLALVVAAVFAWNVERHWFLGDDAFITFCYALHLVDGHGPVWNPGERKGDALTDLAAGEWRQFVCVEAAAVGERAVTLAPGTSHTLRTRIEVVRTDDAPTQED